MIKDMADRSSARIFGKIFELLAKNPTDEHKEMANEMWKMTHGYDFAFYQMECNSALTILGLSKRGINPDYPDEGETFLYAEIDGKFT